MINYIPRVGKIYVVALTASFAQVLTKAQARSVRAVKMKMRFIKGQAPPFFQVAMSDSPDANASSGSGIYTLSGNGSGDMWAASNGIWARVRDSADAGKYLEIMTFG